MILNIQNIKQAYLLSTFSRFTAQKKLVKFLEHSDHHGLSFLVCHICMIVKPFLLWGESCFTHLTVMSGCWKLIVVRRSASKYVVKK